jgi:hypothetical protein
MDSELAVMTCLSLFSKNLRGESEIRRWACSKEILTLDIPTTRGESWSLRGGEYVFTISQYSYVRKVIPSITQVIVLLLC